MKTFLKAIPLVFFLGFTAVPAFAIDQVKLTNGQVVEGTVLNDMTNLYVDIRLVNGDSRRIPHSEIASVDRDVPSRKDRDLSGNQSLGFVAVNLGGFYITDSVQDNKVLFDYGIKAGVIAGQIGDTKLGFAVSYDRASHTENSPSGLSSASVAFNDINLQLLFMRIANSGFYFGPNVGLMITSASVDLNSADTGGLGDLSGNNSTTNFEAGVGIGYDVYLSDSFSIGPDFRYEHVFGNDTISKINIIKFALSGAIHF